MRVSRAFSLVGDNGKSGSQSVEVLLDGLDVASAQDIAGRTLGSSLFGISDRRVDPRRALVGLKFQF